MFEKYIGIDYSGAGLPVKKNRGLQIFMASTADNPTKVQKDSVNNWNRKEIAYWCLELLKRDEPLIIGIDHGFSFPMSYMKRYQIGNWDHFLEDFQENWPTDKDNLSVESLRDNNKRTGHHTEFRLTEKWTTSAQSVFKLDGAGTVGKSTHSGIPWLRFLRKNSNSLSKPHFWPFDGFEIPADKSVIVEIFPSIFRKRYPKRYKTTDEHDAMCVAQWLKNMDNRGLLNTYFKPPLTAEEREIAKLEGWILGVY